jgi:NADPH:quinone reductase-like Zn-dependent oxidoreductase
MKSVNHAKYGSSSVLKLSDVKKPKPKDNEVLIKIHTMALSAPDRRLMRGPPSIIWLVFGLIKPKYQIIEMDLKWTIYN